ncbi:MAG TPA: SDR family oxidoreductase [Candidatus Binataceae bacterium]|nr:SDR family oxidoreductase [Candidatus Binataceae bacterium]
MVAEYSLAGKIALITGAGRGIGTGIAEVFAEAQATVIVNALTDRYLGPFAARLRERFAGTRIIALTGDATTSTGASRLIAQALEAAGGPLDILVNNLGDAIRGDLVPLPGATQQAELSDSDIERNLGLNLMSAVYCTRAAAGAMVARRRGKVINISSFGGLKGTPHLSMYSVGKFGLAGLTRSLALEWAPFGVTVNTIAPGHFPDPITTGEAAYRRMVEQRSAEIPLKRVGQLREVGLLALYLASAASDYMTGQVLALDGGLSA